MSHKSKNYNSKWKKLWGCRNTQEKLEKHVVNKIFELNYYHLLQKDGLEFLLWKK